MAEPLVYFYRLNSWYCFLETLKSIYFFCGYTIFLCKCNTWELLLLLFFLNCTFAKKKNPSYINPWFKRYSFQHLLISTGFKLTSGEAGTPRGMLVEQQKEDLWRWVWKPLCVRLGHDEGGVHVQATSSESQLVRTELG